MEITAFTNWGKYGDHEGGISIVREDGTGVCITETGVINSEIVKHMDVKRELTERELCPHLFNLFRDRLCGDLNLQRKLIGLFHPEVIEEFKGSL